MCFAWTQVARSPTGHAPTISHPGSAAWMVLGVQLFQSCARDLSINLRCREISMAKQHLHHAQIRAVVQQMRSERMT
jgi:hypothetical protein